MPTTITPFLMFTGRAEEALNSYIALFPGSRIVSLSKYGPNAAGKEGTVEKAVFELAGQRVMCIDSPVPHGFTFTPSISLFVDCESEPQLRAAFEKLSQDGQVLMPLNNYGFSRQFCWLQDRFGVSWQLNLP